MTLLDVRSMTSVAEAAAGDAMLHQDRWEEIRRLHFEEHRSVSAIARLLDLDRKTVRRCLRDTAWRPSRRESAEFAQIHVGGRIFMVAPAAPGGRVMRPDVGGARRSYSRLKRQRTANRTRATKTRETID